MDPITAIGAVASIWQIAQAALSLSKTLYTFSAAVGSATEDIQTLADDLKTFSQSLTLLSRLLEDSKSWYSDDIYLLTAKIIKDCGELYVKIDKILVKLGSSGKSTWKLRVKFVYKETQIQKLLTRLRDMKGTLATILMSLQVDLQLSLLNISSTSKIQRPPDKPLQPDTLRILQEAQKSIMAGGVLSKYTVQSEAFIQVSEKEVLISTTHSETRQSGPLEVISTGSVTNANASPSSRIHTQESSPTSSHAMSSFIVLPTNVNTLPSVMQRNMGLTSTTDAGISLDGPISSQFAVSQTPTDTFIESRSLHYSSSTESFKSAMSVQEHRLELARKVKAIQSVMHSFRTALQILENLIERRIPESKIDLFRAAKGLEMTLNEGKMNIDRHHIRHFKEHGDTYLKLFDATNSSEIQVASSELMKSVVMTLHEYSAEHEKLHASNFDNLCNCSKFITGRVEGCLNHLAFKSSSVAAYRREMVAKTAARAQKDMEHRTRPLPPNSLADTETQHDLSPGTYEVFSTFDSTGKVAPEPQMSLPLIGFTWKRFDHLASFVPENNHNVQALLQSTKFSSVNIPESGSISIPPSESESKPMKIPEHLEDGDRATESGTNSIQTLNNSKADLKRLRNTAISARFKVKKKGREQSYGPIPPGYTPTSPSYMPTSSSYVPTPPGPRSSAAWRTSFSKQPETTSGEDVSLLPTAIHRSMSFESGDREQPPGGGYYDDGYSFANEAATIRRKDKGASSGKGASSAYEDKLNQAAHYQDDVGGPIVPLTAEVLRRQQRREAGSSRSTKGSASPDESDYKKSATTRTTRSGSGGDDENVTIKVTGQARVMVGGAQIDCTNGGANFGDLPSSRPPLPSKDLTVEAFATLKKIKKRSKIPKPAPPPRELAPEEEEESDDGFTVEYPDTPGGVPIANTRRPGSRTAASEEVSEEDDDAQSEVSEHMEHSNLLDTTANLKANEDIEDGLAAKFEQALCSEESDESEREDCTLNPDPHNGPEPNSRFFQDGATTNTNMTEQKATPKLAEMQAYQEQLLSTVPEYTKDHTGSQLFLQMIELTPAQIEEQKQAAREYKLKLMPGHDPDSKESNEAHAKALQDYQMSLMTLNCRVRRNPNLRMVRAEDADKPVAVDHMMGGTGRLCGFEFGDMSCKATDILQDFDFDSFLHQDPTDPSSGLNFDNSQHQGSRDMPQDFDFNDFQHEDSRANKFNVVDVSFTQPETKESEIEKMPKENKNTSSFINSHDTSSHDHEHYIMHHPLHSQEAESFTKEELPLYVNSKQFHRILKRRAARQRLTDAEHHQNPARRFPSTSGSGTEQEEEEERKSKRSKTEESPSTSQLSKPIQNLDIGERSRAEKISTPSKIPISTQMLDLDADYGKVELTWTYPALSPTQTNKLWWQAYISLIPYSASESPLFTTIKNALESEIGVQASRYIPDEAICKQISNNIRGLTGFSYLDRGAIGDATKIRTDVLRIVQTVEEQLGLEVATLGWGCVYVLLSLYEKLLTSPLTLPTPRKFFLASYTNLQTIVSIIARYAVMENLYSQSSTTLSLKPEYRSALLSLCVTMLEYFATAIENAQIKFNLAKREDRTWDESLREDKKKDEESEMKVAFLVELIRQKDVACQGFRVVVDAVDQEGEEGSESQGTEMGDVSSGDDDWERVEMDDVDMED